MAEPRQEGRKGAQLSSPLLALKLGLHQNLGHQELILILKAGTGPHLIDRPRINEVQMWEKKLIPEENSETTAVI